jgi:hypothetical protein
MTDAQMKRLIALLEAQHAELVALLRELCDRFNDTPGSA